MALRDILIKIGGDTSHYEKSMRDLKLTTKKATQAAITMWAGVGTSIYSAYKVWDMAKVGAKMQQERQSFDALAASYGHTGQSIIDTLRKASAETVDMMTLVNKAGTAMMMGLNPADLSKLMEIARATSRQTGQSVVEAFSDISLAVGRQSKMILDNLGIIVRVEDANAKYAQSLKKTTSQLTDADKRQAFLNATIDAGQDLMRRMGNENVTASEKAQQIEARIKDIGDTIKTLLIPNLESWAGWLKNIDDYWSRVLLPGKELTVIDTFNKQIDAQSEAIEKAQKRLSLLREEKSGSWLNRRMFSTDKYYATEIEKQTLELQKLEAQLERTIKAKKSYESKTAGIPSAAGGGAPEQADTTAWYDAYLVDDKKIKTAEASLKAFFAFIDEREARADKAISSSWLQDIDAREEAYKDILAEEEALRSKRLEISRDVTGKINALTMSELDYKKWALDEEVRALKAKAGEDQALLKKIETYHSVSLKKLSEKTNTFADDMKDAFQGWATSYSSTLNDMLWNSELTFDGILESFGKMITQMMIQKQMLRTSEWVGENAGNWFKIIGGAVGSYFGGGGGGGGVDASGLSDGSQYKNYAAKGNTFSGQGIKRYENMIINRPTLFPLARGGRIGLMGEAGSEAVLPLTRTSSGNLGVEAKTGGGGTMQYVDMRGSSFMDKETMSQYVSSIARAAVESHTIEVIRDDYQHDGFMRRMMSME